MRLDGKIVLVTGAGRGIGKAVVHQMGGSLAAACHATARGSTVGIFHLNGRRLATVVYHPDRTEWR